MFPQTRKSRPGVCLVLIATFVCPIAAAAEPENDYARVDGQLSALIDLTLARHPAIEELERQAEAIGARVGHHHAWPESSITYRWFAQTPETRVGPQRQSIELSQPLRHGKMHHHAARGDLHRRAATEWRAESARRRLVADLKRAYFEAAFVQEALAVNTDEDALMRRYEQIALKRYATGEGNQQDVIKVQTDINRLAEKSLDLQQRMSRLTARIAFLIGAPENLVDLHSIRLHPIEDAPDLATILERDRPDLDAGVRTLNETIAAGDADLERIRASTRPDFSVGFGWVDVGTRDDTAGMLAPPSDNGQDIFSLKLGVRFPADRRKIRAELAETASMQDARRSRLRSVEDGRTWALRDAWARFDALGDRIDLYAGAIVPQSERSRSAAEAAYTTGRTSFLELLDAQRVTFEARLALHRLSIDRWIAATDLEEALGQPFPSTGVTR